MKIKADNMADIMTRIATIWHFHLQLFYFTTVFIA